MEKQTLINYFREYTGIDFDKNKNLRDSHFFSEKIKITPRELAGLVLALKENGEQITDETLLEGEFSSFNKVYSILK